MNTKRLLYTMLIILITLVGFIYSGIVLIPIMLMVFINALLTRLAGGDIEEDTEDYMCYCIFFWMLYVDKMLVKRKQIK